LGVIRCSPTENSPQYFSRRLRCCHSWHLHIRPPRENYTSSTESCTKTILGTEEAHVLCTVFLSCVLKHRKYDKHRMCQRTVNSQNNPSIFLLLSSKPIICVFRGCSRFCVRSAERRMAFVRCYLIDEVTWRELHHILSGWSTRHSLRAKHPAVIFWCPQGGIY